MKARILASLAALLIGSVSLAHAGEKHAVNCQAIHVEWTTAEVQTLAREVAGTGVNWVLVELFWGWSEPSAPTSSPQGPHSYFGPTVQAWHNYDFRVLDQVVDEMRTRNINIVMKFDHHPTWAGGQPCVGFRRECGIIYDAYKQIFKDNLHDYAHNIASRYPFVTNWIVWNEPNLAEDFSPQSLDDGFLINEYMRLIQYPASAGITEVIFRDTVTLIGPDLFTAEGGGDSSTCDYWGHCALWLAHWTDSLLRYYATPQWNFFDKFSIHNYSIDERGQIAAVGNVWNKMTQLGRQRPIWMTEFNFRRGTCDSPELWLLGWTQAHYDRMTWERSFFFTLQDSEDTCGFGLLRSRANGFAEKTVLYSGFRDIVTCRGKPCGDANPLGGTCCLGSGCVPVFCPECQAPNSCGSACDVTPGAACGPSGCGTCTAAGTCDTTWCCFPFCLAAPSSLSGYDRDWIMVQNIGQCWTSRSSASIR